MIKRWLKALAVLAVLGALGFASFRFLYPGIRDRLSVYRDAGAGVSYVCAARDRAFYLYRNGRWAREFIKGVNIGATKPGSFPGELAITREEYLRWFEEIREMNADAIRVYTLQSPEFYRALWEFNRRSARPLYLFHGVWIDEGAIAETMDAFSPAVTGEFQQNIREVVDAIHGNARIAPRKGKGWGVYDKDVSPYVIGWILGLEWEPAFVAGTNAKNSGVPQFRGAYLFTEGARPFEVWLARMGEYAIAYETERYRMQRPLSFVNWPTTDVMRHPNEPNRTEDMVSVNVEAIKARKSFPPGCFASYHVYPYYPDFMFYQREYAAFRDASGRPDTYRAYLRDLLKNHTLPVFIAEFGVPTSRGVTHVNPVTGFNQGGIEERQQGEMLVAMLRDIHEEGCAGALIFCWQDEWFKRTWNTMDLDIADRRPFWLNVQTSEQRFGILSFDPGEKERGVCVDGDASEWSQRKPLLATDEGELCAAADEEGVYFLLRLKRPYREGSRIIIPIDTIPGQGNEAMKGDGVDLGRPCEFVVVIDGKRNSRVLVDAYYNPFYYIYGEQLKMLERDSAYYVKGSGEFRPIFLCLSRPVFLPQEKRAIPLKKVETGRLRFGNANPAAADYDSLADFAYKGSVVELRIPWQLLNIMDPSSRMAMADLHGGGITPVKIPGFYVSFLVLGDGSRGSRSAPRYAFFTWREWKKPSYHERLKRSYEIVKRGFAEISG
ncbi:MAG: family 2 glycosyl transferase [Thermacetogeniaceae bacterium]